MAATDRSWAEPQLEQSDQEKSAPITTSDRVTTEQDQDKGEEDDREGDGMDEFGDFGDWQDVPESQDNNADEDQKKDADNDDFADFLSAPVAADKEPEQEEIAIKKPVI